MAATEWESAAAAERWAVVAVVVRAGLVSRPAAAGAEAAAEAVVGAEAASVAAAVAAGTFPPEWAVAAAFQDSVQSF